MPPVYFARFYKSDPSKHLGNMTVMATDEDGAVEQSKTMLAERFRFERLAADKPTLVDVCEALGNNEFRILRRFYLLPDGGFREQPLEAPDKGRIHRAD